MARLAADELRVLLGDARNIRNVAVVGDRGHGKTSLVRALATAQTVRFDGPKQVDESDTTLVVTPLVYSSVNSQHVIHIIDTPGSLDDVKEIEAALTLADGVVTVVDPFDGVGLLVEKVVEKAVGLGKKIVLVINQFDARPLDSSLCLAAIEAVNTVIRHVCADLLPFEAWKMDPAIGNVIIGSAARGWGFPVGDALESNASFRRAVTSACSLEPLPSVDADDDWVEIQPSRRPLAESVLRAILLHVPSPLQSHPFLPRDGIDVKWKDAVRYCDPNGPLVVQVVKMGFSTDTNELVAIGRVLAGTLSLHQTVQTISYCTCEDPDAKKDEEARYHPTHITFLGLGSSNQRGLDGVDIPAGNLCALFGVDNQIYRSGIITTCEPKSIEASPFFHQHQGGLDRPSVIRVALHAEQKSEFTGFLDTVKHIFRTNLNVDLSVEDESIVLAARSERQLLRCLDELDSYLDGDIAYSVSEPFFFYQETVTADASTTILAKSPNKHIRLLCTATPLSPALTSEWSSPLAARLPFSHQVIRLTETHDWSERDASRIISDAARGAGPNAFVNQCTRGLHTYGGPFEQPLAMGFKMATAMGVMCFEPVVGLRLDLRQIGLFGELLRHWKYAQLMIGMRTAVFACQLMSAPALLEPIVAVELTGEINLPMLKEELNARGGHMLSVNVNETKVRISIPARQSLGLQQALGDAATMQSVVDHYDQMDGDPLDPTSPAGATVRALRIAKHLDPDVPALSRFHYDHL